MMTEKSYFPMMITITEKNHKDFGKSFIVEHDELPIGVSFVVVKTNATKVLEK